MLTFLQRCCAQFKKSTQSLEHVNLFQEAIPFASAASLAQRRSFMPHESISIILKRDTTQRDNFQWKPVAGYPWWVATVESFNMP